MHVGEVIVRTLKEEDFIKAYRFSAKDGYRRDQRGKKDSEIILMLENHLRNAI